MEKDPELVRLIAHWFRALKADNREEALNKALKAMEAAGYSLDEVSRAADRGPAPELRLTEQDLKFLQSLKISIEGFEPY